MSPEQTQLTGGFQKWKQNLESKSSGFGSGLVTKTGESNVIVYNVQDTLGTGIQYSQEYVLYKVQGILGTGIWYSQGYVLYRLLQLFCTQYVL